MARQGKKLKAVKEKAPVETIALGDAISFLKDNGVATFDETLDMSIRLGVDPKKSENAVRGTVALPHGTGKSIKILVFAKGAAADAAKEAGADFVGFEDMIEKVKGGWTGFDIAISTPDAMKEVRTLGRVLGPRGLMPNPKTGTVTDDVASAVDQARAGRVEFRMDKDGSINVPFGKRSFDLNKLEENAHALLSAVKAEQPSGLRVKYIKSCALSTTMGVGIKVLIED
jgi:large subunit ribosomal protein L1